MRAARRFCFASLNRRWWFNELHATISRGRSRNSETFNSASNAMTAPRIAASNAVR